MEATLPGDNRTGALSSAKGVGLMLEAVQDLSPPVPISTLQMDIERQSYIVDADSVGSIPPLNSARRKSGASKGGSVELSLLLDKLGERIAFERTGTRLYSALITKYLALANSGEDPLWALNISIESEGDDPTVESGGEQHEAPAETLHRIRSEELAHFRMLCDCVTALGGDPTAQTPCADVTAAASMGLMQVLTDPRTTLAQCLNTMLTAELTDNAGWDLLIQLAEGAGQDQLTEPFTEALEAEQRHLAVIQAWLHSLLMNPTTTPAA